MSVLLAPLIEIQIHDFLPRPIGSDERVGNALVGSYRICETLRSSTVKLNSPDTVLSLCC